MHLATTCALVLKTNMRGRTHRRRKQKKLKLIPLNFSDDNIYLLSQWMSGRGFKPSKRLKPKIFAESGRGLMAEETVYPGDVVISIPQNLLITPKSVLNSYLGSFFKKYHPKATGHEILSVFLMCEHSKGQLSEWHPYIASLPQQYSIPVYFCTHALLLLPKSVYLFAKIQCDSVKNSFSQLQTLLSKLQATDPAFANILDYKLFIWAWSSVNTRCIFMECLNESCDRSLCTYHLALAPVLDLLNHSIDVQVHAGFNKEKKCYEIISCNKFKKYSQVFISYGCHDNQKLFLEYGFVIPKNYNDYVAFTLDEIILAFKLCSFSCCSSLAPKLKFIRDNNLIKNAVCSCDGFSWNLEIIMKILLSEYNIRLWNSFLHEESGPKANHPEFLRFKTALLRMKIDEYRLDTLVSKCTECFIYQNLISTLCFEHQSVLRKALT